MERILAIFVEMWLSDDWRNSRAFVIVLATITFFAFLFMTIGTSF